MKSYPFACVLTLTLASALAQPTRLVPPAAPDLASEQRRSELREALRGARAAEPRQSPVSVAQPAKRQLSAQERADLRHQLRQQVPRGKPERP